MTTDFMSEAPYLEVDEAIDGALRSFETRGFVEEDDFENQNNARFDLREMAERDALWTVAGMMRAARRISAELDRSALYLTRLEAEISRRNASKVRQYEFLCELIREYGESLLLPGSKHVDVPGVGRIQYRDIKESLSIKDHDAFMGALDADEKARLVEMRPHLKTNEAKQYQQAVLETEGGQLLPGVERVEARRTASISFEGVGS